MVHLTPLEKRVLAEEAIAVIKAALAPVLEREFAVGTCARCVGRSVSVGLMQVLAYYASVVTSPNGVDEVMTLMRAALDVEIAERAAEQATAAVGKAVH
jgi:hypothetical protein